MKKPKGIAMLLNHAVWSLLAELMPEAITRILPKCKNNLFYQRFLDWRTFTGFSACSDESSGPFEGNWVNLKSVQIIWTCFISHIEPKWNSNLNERLAISEENLFQLQINFVSCRKIVGDLARILDITVIPWNIRISGFTVCRRLLLDFCYRRNR